MKICTEDLRAEAPSVEIFTKDLRAMSLLGLVGASGPVLRAFGFVLEAILCFSGDLEAREDPEREDLHWRSSR